jgi:3-oxoadipate enol-lactonase
MLQGAVLIETRMGRLFVEERGEGAPIILWHSFLCDGGMWRFQVPALAERYRVINVDGPGHGRSMPIRRAFTLEECAEVGVEIMDALGVERAHWAGLSWGAMTGMRVALASPARVLSLALLDTSAHAESREKLPRYKALALAARLFGPGLPLLLDRLGPIFFCRRTIEEKPELVRDLRDLVARMDAESVLRGVDAIIFGRRSIVDRLPEIRVPTLVLVGEEDTATPPSKSRAIADRIPGARYVEIPHAGHLSTLERPEPVTAALLEHLSACR